MHEQVWICRKIKMDLYNLKKEEVNHVQYLDYQSVKLTIFQSIEVGITEKEYTAGIPNSSIN
ncbi:hypothetical protein COE51_23565 [Bacillus pseudomycoides]|nr:hypothetical protein COE51_23565 [Bacillus pseudomycoides]